MLLHRQVLPALPVLCCTKPHLAQIIHCHTGGTTVLCIRSPWISFVFSQLGDNQQAAVLPIPDSDFSPHLGFLCKKKLKFSNPLAPPLLNRLCHVWLINSPSDAAAGDWVGRCCADQLRHHCCSSLLAAAGKAHRRDCAEVAAIRYPVRCRPCAVPCR